MLFLSLNLKSAYDMTPQHVFLERMEEMCVAGRMLAQGTSHDAFEVSFEQILEQSKALPNDRVEFLKTIKSHIDKSQYNTFLLATSDYRKQLKYEVLYNQIIKIFGRPHLFPYLVAMKRFFHDRHKTQFENSIRKYIIVDEIVEEGGEQCVKLTSKLSSIKLGECPEKMFK